MKSKQQLHDTIGQLRDRLAITTGHTKRQRIEERIAACEEALRDADDHLVKMNRSGQRRGAVGSRPTVCCRKILDMVEEGTISPDASVFDFGAGKWAQQTAILRDRAGLHVTPYDVGENDHGTELSEVYCHDVVMMSNVLNVQESMGHVEALLNRLNCEMRRGTLMVCNLPQSPRYGQQTPRLVREALYNAGFEIVRQETKSGGTTWIVLA